MATGKGDASKASRLLSNPKTSKNVKSVAGSDLAQAKGKPQKKKQPRELGRRHSGRSA